MKYKIYIVKTENFIEFWTKRLQNTKKRWATILAKIPYSGTLTLQS